MQLLGSREGMGSPGADDDGGAPPRRAPQPATRASAPAGGKPAAKPSTGFDDMDDDIPF